MKRPTLPVPHPASLSRHGQKNRKAKYGSLILEGSKLTRIFPSDWQFVGTTLLK